MKLNLSRLMTPSDARTCVAAVGILGALACGMAAQGCTHVQDACAETAAKRASASVLVSDAEARLDEARLVVAKIANPDTREKALVAIAGADAGLDAARETLAGIGHLCESFDVQAAFSDFVKAWGALAPFISLLGGPNAGSAVKTPLVVGM